MPGMLDVMRGNQFGVVSLTTAINKLPHVPGRLGQMNLFQEQGIPTLDAFIEEKHGKLSLVSTSMRGAFAEAAPEEKRVGRSFRIPHIKYRSAVLADDVQGVRAFGTENEVETVAGRVNDKLAGMKQDIEATKEYHRIGAVQGKVLDADGSTVVYDWFTQFSITPTVMPIDFTNDDSIKLTAAAILRHMGDQLGLQPVTSIHALVGQNMMDKLMTSTEAKKAYDRYQESLFLRDQQARSMFPYAGVMWEEYRGAVGGTKFIDDDQIRLFPIGVPQLFQCIYAPANYTETVNTVGLPYYAKQERLEFDIGVKLEAQTNPLFICTRPSVLVEAYDAAVGGS